MALLGIYVGVIPVALGMLWLPFVRRIDRRWLQALLAFTIGLLAFLGVDALIEGVETAQAGSQAFGGPGLVFVGALAAYLLLAGSTAGSGSAAAGPRPRAPRRRTGDADRDRHRPAQPRRGPGDRNLLRGRRAGPRHVPRRRLRDPQHDRGPRDRRARWPTSNRALGRLAVLGARARARRRSSAPSSAPPPTTPASPRSCSAPASARSPR